MKKTDCFNVLRCGGFLRKLSLRGCQAVGDSALATFSQYCNNIELLNLKYCKKISDRTSQSLSMHCHKLQYLDVSSCSAVTDISMHALAQGCPNLVHLDISWCDMITGNGIKSLAEGCRKLQNFIAKGWSVYRFFKKKLRCDFPDFFPQTFYYSVSILE